MIDERTARSSFLHERRPAGPSGAGNADRYLLENWRDSAFLDEATFQQRIAASGHSAETFADLIGTGSFATSGSVEQWLAELRTALAVHSSRRGDRRITLYGNDFDRIFFASVVDPVSAYYTARLEIDLSNVAETDVKPELLTSMSEQLDTRLVILTHRTLITEVHRLRAEGELRGASPADRYEDFNDRVLIDRDYLEELWCRYPVLGRSIVVLGRQWLSSCRELLHDVAEDDDQLTAESLLAHGAGRLKVVRAGLGDVHLGGRSASELVFHNGSRLIYKPRPVEPEALYAQVVQELNQMTGLEMRAAQVLPRGDHGWCEYVCHDEVYNVSDFGRYYRRLGGVLAVLHVLGTTDMHLGNIIAAGDQPVPVDLETIFQPPSIIASGVGKANDLALDVLSRSVLSTSMLPQRVFGDGVNPGVDISGIGGGTSRFSARPLPRVVAAFTDQMAIEAERRELGRGANRPYKGNEIAEPGDHAADILAGFTEAYDAIMMNKEVFARIIEGAADTRIRTVLRNTRRYDLFLYEARHPRYLRDGKDQDRMLDKLWTTVPDRPDLAAVAESERRQLLCGDVPSFSCIADSRDLLTGNELVQPGFFREAPLESAKSNIEGLDESHRALQLRIIADSLSTLPGCSAEVSAHLHRPSDLSESSSLAQISRACLDHLSNDALLGSEDCTWIGIGVDGLRDESLTYKPLTTTFYDGLAGMAVVYAHAAAVFGSQRYADLAWRCLTPVVAELANVVRNGGDRPVGAYAGLAGALYAAHEVGNVLQDETHQPLLMESVPHLMSLVVKEKQADLISGIAGCLAVTTRLHARCGEGLHELEELADLAVERLETLAVTTSAGLGWGVEPGNPLLGGFSHGSAGIGWALLQAGVHFDDRRAERMGRRGLSYDESLKNFGEGGWQDLRDFPDNTGNLPGKPVQWCHGATGIGISRVLAYRLTGDGGYLESAKSAVAAVCETGSLPNQSLCHGTSGSIEFLGLASDLYEAEERNIAEQRRTQLLDELCAELRSTGFSFGRISGQNVPGLMMGKAGVCMTLLRAASPRAIPSPLWFDASDSPQPEVPR